MRKKISLDVWNSKIRNVVRLDLGNSRSVAKSAENNNKKSCENKGIKKKKKVFLLKFFIGFAN